MLAAVVAAVQAQPRKHSHPCAAARALEMLDAAWAGRKQVVHEGGGLDVMGPLAKLYGLSADLLQRSILPAIHDRATTMFRVFVNFVATRRLSRVLRRAPASRTPARQMRGLHGKSTIQNHCLHGVPLIQFAPSPKLSGHPSGAADWAAARHAGLRSIPGKGPVFKVFRREAVRMRPAPTRAAGSCAGVICTRTFTLSGRAKGDRRRVTLVRSRESLRR